MNVSQQIFTIFFAIFWGNIGNALPRWKAFHWTYFRHDRRVCCRIFWSFAILNVLPVLLLAYVFLLLGSHDQKVIDWIDVIVGVIPAFSIFGIYRLWMAGVEFRPTWFYYQKEQDQPCVFDGVEDPTIERLGIRHDNWIRNFLPALIYLLPALVIILILR